MKKASKITVLIAATLLSVGVTLRAAQITGEITFTGSVNLNTASAGTATAVTGWHGFGGVGNPLVVDASGDFAPYVIFYPLPGYTTGIFQAPWFFNSGPVPAFWTAGGFTFDLTSSAIISQGGIPPGVVVTGSGFISGNGFDITPGVWGFSTQDPSADTPQDFLSPPLPMLSLARGKSVISSGRI